MTRYRFKIVTLAVSSIVLLLSCWPAVADDLGNPHRAGDLGFYGWRGRLGIITPTSYRGVVIQLEFNQMKPVGTDMIVENVYLGRDLTEEALTAMNKDAVGAAKKLKDRGADIILYACTSGSFMKGPEYEQQLLNSIKDATGLPTATMVGSVIEALQTLKAKKIILISPYPPALDERVKKFLAHYGFEVVSYRSEVYYKHSSEIADALPGFFYRLAKQAYVKGADAIFISGGNVRALEVLDIMEKDFGIPAISSNSASIWKSLRMAGINEKIPGYGKLLREY
jgi:maleate isomerase